MKRHTLKLILSFTIIFLLIGLLIAYAYNSIYQAFILTNAKTEMSLNGENLAKTFTREVQFDYNTFSKTVTNNENPLEVLENSNFPFAFYGEILEDEIVISNESYEITVNHYQILELNNKNYLVLIKDDYVAFLDLDTYLSKLFTMNYIFMNRNNTIYSTNTGLTEKFFYDILRKEGISEVYIENLKNDVISGKNFTFDKPFKSTASFYTLAYEQDFYFVFIVDEKDVLITQKNISYSLLAMMGGLFVLLSFGLVVLFRVLSQRLSDIELAKYSYYYNKPYIFFMRRNGKIKDLNASLKAVPGFPNNIFDLVIKEKQEIMSFVDKQASFIAILDEGNLLIRFIPLKKNFGYLFVGEDITKEEKLYEEYEKVALFNKITNLPNRNFLIRDLKELDYNHKNSLIALDVVSFGKLNLYLGDRATDQFLNVYKELILDVLNTENIKLYNIERDRFIILCHNLNNYNDTVTILDKLFTRLKRQIAVGSTYIDIDIKAGILYLDEKIKEDSAIFNVITALKHAKVSQVNDYIIYDKNLSLIASREEMMEKDLAQAIKNNELYMVMQPQYNSSTRRIVGFEVLIRWDNPKYHNESPQKFITIAEQNNMIIDIGKLIITETAKIAKELEPYDVKVSFNVSPVQLLQTGFVDEVLKIFKEYEVNSKMIGIEVTENFLISSFDLIINKLKLLRQHGYKVYLDDFGSKYSSLQYLRNLPVDAVKIDRAFITDLEVDKHSKAIVNMISSLAKNIGLEVIAEGVENIEQNNILLKNGCEIIQGFVISKAISLKDAKILIEGYNINKTLVLGRSVRN